MSAIGGILRFGGGPDAAPTIRMLMEGMAHRAADGVGFHSDGEFAMAQGCLHSTPESRHGRHPVEVGRRWILAVDGRVDDRVGLARELGLTGVDQAVADDVLFAHAWLRWGTELWRHVVGEFAIAVWDTRDRTLTLLRDCVGQRPLFYARSPRLLAFATEPEPLLGLDGVSRAVDEDALAYLLASTFQPEDRGATFYRDVRRLLPGEALAATRDGGMRLWRYSSMRPGTPLRLRDPREYVEAFREVFGQAVACRLRSVSRPGLMLSGGIDSASVLGAARLAESHDAGLLPISMVDSAAAECDETRNILRMHGNQGIRLPLEDLHDHPVFAALVGACWDRAHPVDNSIMYARLVYLAARDGGSNVVLDGVDGDLVMHADDHYAGASALAGHPIAAWHEAGMASRFHTYLRGTPAWRILLHGMAARMQPWWVAAARYRFSDRVRGDATLGPWIDARFARRLRLRGRILDRAIAERRGDDSRTARLAATWWGPGIIRSLEGADRTAACFGIEARHPWCDQRVLEFFLNLPEEYVVREGWTKWLPRSAYAGVLGAEVVWHSGKGHLGSRVTRHVLQASAGRVSALLDKAEERLGAALDRDALNELRSAWLARESSPGEVDIDQVLLTATLVAWMDRLELSLD